MASTEKPVVVMQRVELKYAINAEQTAFLVEKLKGHMEVDQYGKTSIASLYYDTPDYRLIRTSIEKPPFKEKIRLRSYGLATNDSPVFLELKRRGYPVPDTVYTVEQAREILLLLLGKGGRVSC